MGEPARPLPVDPRAANDDALPRATTATQREGLARALARLLATRLRDRGIL